MVKVLLLLFFYKNTKNNVRKENNFFRRNKNFIIFTIIIDTQIQVNKFLVYSLIRFLIFFKNFKLIIQRFILNKIILLSQIN